ncbi:hypothetical protein A4X06_0g9967 [Tilletia controversa]|uniref:Uncharacterized protein n=1 Tax=Tilletia controversa TaxID=13291 RepID=A0A8X7MI04_9BASI|nr:hypothetical protein A4X06_0g9967 [Tilletia controversa]
MRSTQPALPNDDEWPQLPLPSGVGSAGWTPRGNQHDDDYTDPLQVQPGAEDGYNCGISDIDAVSEALGWPWEPRKDAPWSHIFDFTGIRFNIATREVALPEKKRLKYLRSIAEWKERRSRHRGPVPAR